eukprot:scpid46983/ scgid13927/ Serine/threonine-protein kinase TBK1
MSKPHHALEQTANYIWLTRDYLGSGASAAVFKGLDKRNNRVVAVKRFNQQEGPNGSVRHVHLKEAHVMKQVEHPNLVRFLGMDDFPRNEYPPVIAMEFCNRGSLMCALQEPINYKGMNEDDFRVVLHDITEGIRYLREQNWAHRDIKPGNIMRHITDSGKCVYKLSDFGASRHLDVGEEFTSIVGTPEYLHPRVLQVHQRAGTGRFVQEVELWSIGTTLYQCATGVLPFQKGKGRQQQPNVTDQLLANKPRDAIAARTTDAQGRLIYETKLPSDSKLSKSFRARLEMILRKTLQTDADLVSFEEYFELADELLAARPAHVFHVDTCTHHEVLVNRGDMVAKLSLDIAKFCDVPVGQQQLWFIPFGALQAQDFTEERYQQMPVPVTSVRNPFVLRALSWERKDDLPRVDIGLEPIATASAVTQPTISDDLYQIQRFWQRAHLVQNSIRFLKRNVLCADRSVSVLGTIISGEYQNTLEYFTKQKASLSQLQKIWNAVFSFFQPEADSFIQILSILEIESCQALAVYEELKVKMSHCNRAIEQAAQRFIKNKQFLEGLPAPEDMIPPDLSEYVAIMEKSDAEMSVMLDTLETLARRFATEKRAQNRGTYHPHDAAIHSIDRVQVRKIGREFEALDSRCVKQRAEVFKKLQHQWSECKEYCTALVGQRTSLRDLSNTVLGLEEAVKDLVRKSHECFSDLRSRAVIRIQRVHEVNIDSQEAMSNSLDVETKRKLDKLQELVTHLYKSHYALKEEAAISQQLVSEIQDTSGAGQPSPRHNPLP